MSSADLVIVGAGTIGGWAAVMAREDGAGRVLVVDAGLAGQGASTRAAGMVRTQGGTPTAVDLGRFSVEFYGEQRRRYGIDSDFRELGYLILAVTEEELEAGRERVAMQRDRGVAARLVSPAEAAELLPVLDRDQILGATYCAQDGAIDPGRNVAAYLVAMRARGAELLERTTVTGLRIQGGRVTGVQLADAVIATERVILAGGVGQRALAGLAGPPPPVGGVRHHVFLTSPARVLAHRPMAMGFDVAAGLYWRQEEDGLLFGMSDPDETPGEARAIDPVAQRRARGRLGELIPATRGLGLRKAWAATIDYTPDHLPVLGPGLDARGEPIEGLTIASAGGHGMMWGPGVARVAVDLSLHGATLVTDVSFLGADRFDADGRSRLAADPIALPFPDAVAS
ncbi:MAG TPA: FAD-dependent oxidoreductase [Solirubrobacteraceae bacterium]